MEKEVLSFENDVKLADLTNRLNALRENGVNLVMDLEGRIAATKKNKLLHGDERAKMLEEFTAKLATAKSVAAQNSPEEKSLEKEAVAYVNQLGKKIEAQTIAAENEKIAKLKAEYGQRVEQCRKKLEENENSVKSKFSGSELEEELKTVRYEHKSALFDAKMHFDNEVARCQSAKNQAYIAHIQKNRSLRNGKSNFLENTSLAFRNYIYNFKLSKFFLDNGLYLAILVFFIVCVIIAPISGKGKLLSLPNIFTILEQSSVRMFYALGVAGLILLAGTDLSIGRMVALGSVVTGLILHPGVNIVKFFNMGPWDFTGLPMGFRVVMALVLSVTLCSAFAAFSGVFSARLKMHPFISTLATQLIIYGLLFFGTTGTPVGSIDSAVKDAIGGRWELGYIGTEYITFPKLIVPAVIAVIVAWFIWNKTIFGKNMYAVGGNAEAATVSGISVFKITMMVFVMAGIFYGCGAFLEAFRANASAGTGQGYEMDAIAACVVGGISFNGGIGKISGAVMGVIIFTSLTYCLTFLGIDTNLQFVIKGVIIIAAVALDSVKYLKRK